jgi:ribonuclease G
MRKELIISTVPQETRVALIEDDELVEFMVERRRAHGIAGNIYKGRVTKVLPGMQSAFVDIGLERDAFLYVSDFVEDLDEYDRIVSTAEDEAFRDPSSPASPPRPRPRPARHDRRPDEPRDEVSAEPGAEPRTEPRNDAPSPIRDEAAEPSAEPRTEKGDLARESPASAGLGSDVRPAGRGREERKDRPVAAPSREPAPGSGPRFGAGGAGQPEGERRTERRPRRGRIPSFESREEPRGERPAGGGGFQVLPGETLRKYVSPEGDASPTEPPGDAAPETARHEASNLPKTADEVRPPGDDPQDDAGNEGDEGDDDPRPGNSGPDDASPGSGPARARMTDPPSRARFSKKPPARRSRRRYSSRSDPASGTSSEEPMISDLLRAGQEILVQVSKEPLGKKGARITSHIALPGRYLVYMPTVDHIGVSRKISTEDERARLRQIINDNRGDLPGGFIVRTAAEGRDQEEFILDLRFLGDLWREIRERSEQAKAPAMIHSDLTLVQRVLRDQLTDEFRAIRLDNETEYQGVLEFVSRFQPAMVTRVKLHLKDTPILEEYGFHQEIDKAMKSKVWLKSGGYIVVNQTEALVAIDVNTGKFVGKSNRLEDTIVRTNIDAVHEIVRQIRLRNLGGIIVVDFIDMEERKNRQRVMQALEEELRRDRSPSKILQFNDFGLVAITRKRTQPSLERVLGRPCPRCAGAGFVKAVETVCYEIQQEVGKMLPHIEGRELTVRVNPEVAKAIKNGEFVDFSDIEEQTRKDVAIQADPSLDAERFDIY